MKKGEKKKREKETDVIPGTNGTLQKRGEEEHPVLFVSVPKGEKKKKKNMETPPICGFRGARKETLKRASPPLIKTEEEERRNRDLGFIQHASLNRGKKKKKKRGRGPTMIQEEGQGEGDKLRFDF